MKLFGLGPFIDSGELLFRTLSVKEQMTSLSDPRILRAAEGADVFLDTAIRFMDGDENSAAEQRAFSASLFALLGAGARSVTGLHHSPKGAENQPVMTLDNTLRGTSELGAMLGTAWGTRRVVEDTTQLYVQNIKPRDFEPVGAFLLEGRPHINKTGDFVMVARPGDAGALKNCMPGEGPRREGRPPVVLLETGQKILELAKAGKTNQEMADAVGISLASLKRYKQEQHIGQYKRTGSKP
jgi:hypothetical protein